MRLPLRAALLSSFFLLFSLSFVSAVTIHGTVYDAELRVVQEAVVMIDTEPRQRLLAAGGDYSFELPPGTYTLSATAKQDGIVFSASETVTVAQEGRFAYDLFLFPNLAEDEALSDDIAADFGDVDEEEGSSAPGPWPLLFFLVVVALLFLLPVLWLRRRFRQLDAAPESPSLSVPEPRDEQLDAVLDALRREGGRITQKELRKALPYSEAKVSLLVAELEAKGKVVKLKRGRGNILVLHGLSRPRF